jgi:hypothetical protein
MFRKNSSPKSRLLSWSAALGLGKQDVAGIRSRYMKFPSCEWAKVNDLAY